MKFFPVRYSLQFSLSLFFFNIVMGFSQDQLKIDSLENLLKMAKNDTGKAIVLSEIAMELRFMNPELSLKRAMESIGICKEIKFKRGEAKALTVAGLSYNALGNYEKAIEFHNYAISAFSSIKDSIGIAKAFHNIGYAYSIIGETDSTLKYFRKSLVIAEKEKDYFLTNFNYLKIGEIYSSQGDYPNALGFSQSSLKLSEMANDMEGQSNALNNIGLILMYQKNYAASIEYFLKARVIAEKISDKSYLATNLNNLGLVHEKMNKREEAIKFFLESLRLKEEIGNLHSVVISYSNIARFFQNKGDYSRAIEFNKKALAIDEQLDDKEGMCIDFLQLSGVEIILKNFTEAKNLIEKAISIAETAGYMDLKVNGYAALADLFAKQNSFKEAYKYHRLFSQFKDSLLNEESSKNLNELRTKYETEKKDSEIKLLNKDNEIQTEELKKQRIFIYSAILVIALVLSLVFIIFRSNKQKQLANLRLAKKNQEILLSKKEIEQKNDELENANAAITHQKKEIEEKNEEIVSSIRYAKRIQQAVLKEEEPVTAHLPDHFVLFKPKDIVSGDFYWAKQINDWWYVAVADCTGHGVPGAFLTMLGMSFLNEITITSRRMLPSEILDELRARIIKELGQTGREGESRDGMDISLSAINLKTLEMEWAGANNPLYVIAGSENMLRKILEPAANYLQKSTYSLFEFKADKQPIGYFPEPKPFRNQEFQLQKGDSVILFSDGYADQFGGPKGKKFKYSQLEKLLLSIHENSMTDQKDILISEIEKWKGNLEQIDDICLIGIKV